MRKCELLDLGRVSYAKAFEIQRQLVERRKRGEIPDQLLFVEHPHVITLGRNARLENLLASEDVLRSQGVELQETDRGGDITYHGPGQVVGYPIFDLREWKRDVVAYVRKLEQAIIDAIAGFGVTGERSEGATGVWVHDAKLAAIGVHISRWVTSHGFALNVTTDLDYFRLIVPCGLTRPVTSLAALGCRATQEQVQGALARELSRHFELEITQAELERVT